MHWLGCLASHRGYCRGSRAPCRHTTYHLPVTRAAQRTISRWCSLSVQPSMSGEASTYLPMSLSQHLSFISSNHPLVVLRVCVCSVVCASLGHGTRAPTRAQTHACGDYEDAGVRRGAQARLLRVPLPCHNRDLRLALRSQLPSRHRSYHRLHHRYARTHARTLCHIDTPV